MPVLDDILARQDRVDEQRLAQADHAATWTQTFAPQSPEALRAAANVTNLVNDTLDRKLELAARTDKNAQDIYQKSVKFNNWQQEAPLRDQHLRAQIAAEGATTRFHQQQDAETMNHVAGFADAMTQAPPIGTPEHQAFLLQQVQKFPRVASTPWFRETMKQHAPAHDTAAALAEPASQYFSPEALRKENPGATYRQDPDTGGFIVVRSNGGGDGAPDMPAAALTTLGKLNAEKAVKARYLAAETQAPAKEKLKTDIANLDAQIQGWHDTFQPVKPAATPTPVNPRIALAQQALNDPNASEAHKAAARKILGQ